jgi:hypothetical protein
MLTSSRLTLVVCSIIAVASSISSSFTTLPPPLSVTISRGRRHSTVDYRDVAPKNGGAPRRVAAAAAAASVPETRGTKSREEELSDIAIALGASTEKVVELLTGQRRRLTTTGEGDGAKARRIDWLLDRRADGGGGGIDDSRDDDDDDEEEERDGAKNVDANDRAMIGGGGGGGGGGSRPSSSRPAPTAAKAGGGRVPGGGSPPRTVGIVAGGGGGGGGGGSTAGGGRDGGGSDATPPHRRRIRNPGPTCTRRRGGRC